MLLYRALFDGDIERFFEQNLAASKNAGQRLRIQLSFTGKSADLANLPWEYLYLPDTETREGLFLATNVDVVLSHYMSLELARQDLAPVKSPLRILVVVARPLDLGPVISDPVVESIQELGKQFPIQFNVLSMPTVDKLLDTLERVKPHVVHFIGHGQFKKEEGRGQIALLDFDESGAVWIGDREFADFFVQVAAVPRLVFLHLCEGGAIDFTDNFAGLTPQLIRAGVQAVVAMRYPITNRDAIIFSRAFYSALAKGEPVDRGVQDGRWRITITSPQAYDNPAFGIPVLYMRSRGGIIQPPIPAAVSSDT